MNDYTDRATWSVDFHIKPEGLSTYAKNIDITNADDYCQALLYAYEELELRPGDVVYSVKVIDWALAEKFDRVVKVPEEYLRNVGFDIDAT